MPTEHPAPSRAARRSNGGLLTIREIILLGSGLSLLFAGIGLTAYHRGVQAREQALQAAGRQAAAAGARLLGPMLDATDVSQATATLHSMMVHPEIERIVVSRRAGRRYVAVAGLARQADGTLQPAPVRPTDRARTVTKGIFHNGAALGIVDLEVSARQLEQQSRVLARQVSAYVAVAVMAVLAVTGVIIQQQRLAAMHRHAARARGVLLANVSHEVRTPMNGILGMLELLRHTPLDGQQQHYVGTVQHCARALLMVINDILDHAKIEAGKLTLDRVSFNLVDEVDEVLELFAHAAGEKPLQLAALVDPGLALHYWGDPIRLRQILMNLVGNAVKFTERGEVRVVVGPEPEGPAGSLRIGVLDTGPGIPPDLQRHLFRAFSQGSHTHARKHGGTGLGLVIAKFLVEQMQGRIWLESPPGKGAAFWFTLRLEPHAEAPPDLAPTPATGRLRALVVDDRPLERAAIASQLQRFGVQATLADDSAAAAALVPTAHAADRPYNLLVLNADLAQPPAGEVVQRLRALAGSGPRLRCILVTPAGAAATAPWPATHTIPRPVMHRLLYQLLAHPATAARRARPAAAAAATGPNLRILVVDDSRINRDVAQRQLAQLGHAADLVGDGRQALEQLRQQDYDAVLMDIEMPIMDGMEATRCIRAPGSGAKNPGVHIIAMTAAAMPGDRERFLAAGMNDYLGKPVAMADLAAALRRAAPSATPPGEPAAPPAARPATDSPELAEMHELFEAEAREQVSLMRQALAGSDAPTLRRAAHSLKSAAGLFGAQTLHAACLQLEELARNNRLEGSATLIDQVATELDAVIRRRPEGPGHA